MRTGAIGMAIVGALLLATPALASTNQIEVFLDQVLRGDPGDVFVVHTESIDPTLVGGTCAGTAQTENNASEHPNNDLLIASGGNTIVIADFEAVAGQLTRSSMALTLGESFTVSIRLGGNGISSEGLIIVLSCDPPPPAPTTTTTTTMPTPTTTTTTTTAIAPPPRPRATTTTTTAPPEAATTTTEPPPVGGVSAGGGSMAGGDTGTVLWLAGGALPLAAALLLAALTYIDISRSGNGPSAKL